MIAFKRLCLSGPNENAKVTFKEFFTLEHLKNIVSRLQKYKNFYIFIKTGFLRTRSWCLLSFHFNQNQLNRFFL